MVPEQEVQGQKEDDCDEAANAGEGNELRRHFHRFRIQIKWIKINVDSSQIFNIYFAIFNAQFGLISFRR